VKDAAVPDRQIQLRGEKILIATGSSPVHPDVFPFGYGAIYDSDTILILARIPRTLAVIGAGVIGTEYGCTFRALGAEVHVVDGRDVLLPFLDAEISRALAGALQRSGIEFHWKENVQKCIPLEAGTVRLELSCGAVLTVDAVLVAAGRQSNTAKLKLEKAGVTVGGRGIIPVNEHLQTNLEIFTPRATSSVFLPFTRPARSRAAGQCITHSVWAQARFPRSCRCCLFGGQGPICQTLRGPLQELNHVDLMRPITKFATAVYDAARIPEILGMAFREAYNGRPGPVFVEIPMDVQFSAVDKNSVVDAGKYRSRGKTYGDVELVEDAARLLSGAQRPAILAGSQVWHCRGVAELEKLAGKLDAPVYLNGQARCALPPDSPLLFQRSRREGLAKADVILVLGTPFDFRLGYGKVMGPDAKIIQVDLDQGELGHNRGVDLGITGDSAAVLAQLAAAVGKVPPGQTRPWLEHLRAVEQKALEKDLPFLNSDATTRS
jgi:hypothetical protein